MNIDWRVLRDGMLILLASTKQICKDPRGSWSRGTAWDWDYTGWAGLFLPLSCFTSLSSQALRCIFAFFFCLCIIFYWAWTLLEANNTCSLQPPRVSSVAPAWVPPWRWRFVQGLISEDKYEPVWKSQSLSTYLIWPVGSTVGFMLSTAGLFRTPMRIV